MKKESCLPMVGSFVIIGAFVYLIIMMLAHTVPLNPATWIMWFLLDVFVAYSMMDKSQGSGSIVLGFLLIGMPGYINRCPKRFYTKVYACMRNSL